MKKSDSIPLEPLQYMGPLANDILELRDTIARTFTGQMDKGFKRSEFYKSSIKGGKMRKLQNGERVVVLNPGFEILFLGCMRGNVWVGEISEDLAGPETIGWIQRPTELWGERHMELLIKLRDIFDQAAGKDGLKFLRIGIASEVQIPDWGDGDQPNEPTIIYSTTDGRKFVSEVDAPTHQLLNRSLSRIQLGQKSEGLGFRVD